MKLVQLPNGTCEGYYGKYNATGCSNMTDAEKKADGGWSIYKVYISGGNVVVGQNPNAIWDTKSTFDYPTITGSPTDVEFANLYKAVVECNQSGSPTDVELCDGTIVPMPIQEVVVRGASRTKLCEYHLSGIVGCRAGLPVTRFPYIKSGIATPANDIYSDGGTASGWTEGACPTSPAEDAMVTCVAESTNLYIIDWDNKTNTYKIYNFSGVDVTGTVTPVKCEDIELTADKTLVCDGGITSLWQHTVYRNGIVDNVYFTTITGIAPVIPLGTVTAGACTVAKQIVQVPNCAGTLNDKPVDSLVGAYLLNQENKHTEVVYDSVLATIGGSITYTYTAPHSLAISHLGVTVANDTLLNVWTDFGDGYNDVGPSPDHTYNNDGAYEVKSYLMLNSRTKILIAAKEVTILNGVVTYSGVAGSQEVSRNYSYSVASVFQDFCGSLPVGTPYTATGTAYTALGTITAFDLPILDELEDNADYQAKILTTTKIPITVSVYQSEVGTIIVPPNARREAIHFNRSNRDIRVDWTGTLGGGGNYIIPARGTYILTLLEEPNEGLFATMVTSLGGYGTGTLSANELLIDFKN